MPEADTSCPHSKRACAVAFPNAPPSRLESLLSHPSFAKPLSRSVLATPRDPATLELRTLGALRTGQSGVKESTLVVELPPRGRVQGDSTLRAVRWSQPSGHGAQSDPKLGKEGGRRRGDKEKGQCLICHCRCQNKDSRWEKLTRNSATSPGGRARLYPVQVGARISSVSPRGLSGGH